MVTPPPFADLALKLSATGAGKAVADANAVSRAVNQVAQVYDKAIKKGAQTLGVLDKGMQTLGLGTAMGAMGAMRSGLSGQASTRIGQRAQTIATQGAAVIGTAAVIGGGGKAMGAVGNIVGKGAAKLGLGKLAAGAGALLGGPIGAALGFVAGIVVAEAASALLGTAVGKFVDRLVTLYNGQAIDLRQGRFQGLLSQQLIDPNFVSRQRPELMRIDREYRDNEIYRSSAQTIPINRMLLELGAMRETPAAVEEGMNSMREKIIAIEAQLADQRLILREALRQ